MASARPEAAPVGPPPDAPTVRVIIGTDGGSVAVVYEVDAEELKLWLETQPGVVVAEWVVRNGRELFRTSYEFAYGIGGGP
jgi:hypothetical protein